MGLVDFARKNPGIVVYLKPRRHRRPKIVAEYCKFLKIIQYITIILIDQSIHYCSKWLRSKFGCSSIYT